MIGNLYHSSEPHPGKKVFPVFHRSGFVHVNNIHSLKIISALYTFTQGFLSSPPVLEPIRHLTTSVILFSEDMIHSSDLFQYCTCGIQIYVLAKHSYT